MGGNVTHNTGRDRAVAYNGAESQYEELARLTAQYTEVQGVYEGYARMARSCRQQMVMLANLKQVDGTSYATILTFLEWCEGKTRPLGEYLQAKRQQMDTLNNLIQNGVHNG